MSLSFEEMAEHGSAATSDSENIVEIPVIKKSR